MKWIIQINVINVIIMLLLFIYIHHPHIHQHWSMSKSSGVVYPWMARNMRGGHHCTVPHHAMGVRDGGGGGLGECPLCPRGDGGPATSPAVTCSPSLTIICLTQLFYSGRMFRRLFLEFCRIKCLKETVLLVIVLCKQVFPIFKGKHLSSQTCKKKLGLDGDNFIKVCQRTEYRRYCGQLWPDFMPWVVLCGFLLCENWISPKNKVYLFFKEKGFLLWASAFPCILPPALRLHQNQNHSLIEIPVNKKFTFEAKFWILKKLYFFLAITAAAFLSCPTACRRISPESERKILEI